MCIRDRHNGTNTPIHIACIQIHQPPVRADKQPDVIATTKEGQQYLIEFLFQYKIQHKTAIAVSYTHLDVYKRQHGLLDGILYG